MTAGCVPPPDPHRPEAASRRSDLVLSVVLPLAVIAVGVALSIGGAGSAMLALCRAAFQ